MSHRVFCMCHPTISYEIIKGECLPLNDPPAQRDVGSLAQEQKQRNRYRQKKREDCLHTLQQELKGIHVQFSKA